jgi:hypothetical protein
LTFVASSEAKPAVKIVMQNNSKFILMVNSCFFVVDLFGFYYKVLNSAAPQLREDWAKLKV